jgi:hypothetical protein
MDWGLEDDVQQRTSDARRTGLPIIRCLAVVLQDSNGQTTTAPEQDLSTESLLVLGEHRNDSQAPGAKKSGNEWTGIGMTESCLGEPVARTGNLALWFACTMSGHMSEDWHDGRDVVAM